MRESGICRVEITGVYKSDLALYCAYILQKMGYHVLICDSTGAGEMEHSIRRPGRYMELIRYKDMDFAFSDLVSLDEKYEYIFYLRDFGNMEEIGARWRIWVCDGARIHMEALAREWIRRGGEKKELPDKTILVYRNLYGLHGREYLHGKGLDAHDNVFQCGHDCMDEACYQRLQYIAFTHITEISADLEACIFGILMKITNDGEKQVKRGIRMAKRGSAY